MVLTCVYTGNYRGGYFITVNLIKYGISVLTNEQLDNIFPLDCPNKFLSFFNIYYIKYTVNLENKKLICTKTKSIQPST